MRLGDILRILRFEINIEIRDKDNNSICICNTNSKGVDPYVNYEVVNWFPVIMNTTSADVVFLIDLEDADE